ncbi:hypothetical protein Zmor_001743 [Zophobas morio]|uniref:Myb-like domain-containing protein n=1 Tax=Zophobas morio TaxID=2755281 RepID=A0AA38MT34_9CUCU|nr:hypothetical protein Zmor_026034 [Zophobas morio]KAJ3666291.1 hypothetical protein Zmor_001743 [Zophobas morio]
MSLIEIICDDEPVDDPSEEKAKLNSLTLNNLSNGGKEEAPSVDKVSQSDMITSAEKSERRSNISSTVITEWSDKETKYLLKKYNKYILHTGHNKKFRTKKELWNHIAYEIQRDLKADKSGFQCENRYKTILRKWRKKEKSNKGKQYINSVGPQLNTNGPNISKKVTVVEENKKKELPDVMWEIFKQKEESRERRHKEKMQLIKSLLQNYI